MKKIGISCRGIITQYGIERGLEICKESGFDSVDFGLESYKVGDSVYGGSDDAFETHFDMIRRKAEDLELEIAQTHGRCVTYFPNNEEQNRMIDKVSELDLRASSILGAPSCVIHFINSTRWGLQPPSVMHKACGEMFDKFLPFAEKYKVNIAMETFGGARIKGKTVRDFFADPTEFTHQFDRLDTKYKTICVDTGHTHGAEIFWVPAPEDMIRALGKDVTLLHMHDNRGETDDHLLPGMGTIKWPAVFDALDDIDYQGVYNFELAISFAKTMLEEYTHFVGKYLRNFVDNHGSLK